METFIIESLKHEELIDITPQVEQIVLNSKKIHGICCVYTPHTTASITVNENADPSVKTDIIRGLSHLKFENVPFAHTEGNSPSHIKSSIFGCSQMLIIENSKLELGTWQGIFFCEFDGPRSRKVMVQII